MEDTEIQRLCACVQTCVHVYVLSWVTLSNKNKIGFLVSGQNVLPKDSMHARSWRLSWQKTKTNPRWIVEGRLVPSLPSESWVGCVTWEMTFRQITRLVGRGQKSPLSNLLIFWEMILLIYIHTRLCPKPEGFCLIHHAPRPHNGTPDKQNIG